MGLENGGRISPTGGRTGHVHYLPDMPGAAELAGAGPGLVSFTHHQPTGAAVWTIDHDLGWRPTVQVVDSGGSPVTGTVDHVTVNQLTISFASGGSPQAISGYAYLS
jgi:hypothetical protein